jgi:hypothetical protein
MRHVGGGHQHRAQPQILLAGYDARSGEPIAMDASGVPCPLTGDAVTTVDRHRLAGGRDGRGNPQVRCREYLVRRLIGKEGRNEIADSHDRAHPAGGRTAPGDLREDFGDDVVVRLVAADVSWHRQPEDPGFGQFTQVVGMHTAKPFGLRGSCAELVDQRIDLCEYTFSGARGV